MEWIEWVIYHSYKNMDAILIYICLYKKHTLYIYKESMVFMLGNRELRNIPKDMDSLFL